MRSNQYQLSLLELCILIAYGAALCGFWGFYGWNTDVGIIMGICTLFSLGYIWWASQSHNGWPILFVLLLPFLLSLMFASPFLLMGMASFGLFPLAVVIIHFLGSYFLRNNNSFRHAAAVAMAATLLVCGYFVARGTWLFQKNIASNRQNYPIVSLAQRLAYETERKNPPENADLPDSNSPSHQAQVLKLAEVNWFASRSS